MPKQIIYIFLIWLFPITTNAIDLTKINFSYLYDGTINIKHQVAYKNDSFKIYFKINFKADSINYLYQKNYKDNKHEKIKSITEPQDSTKESYVYYTSIPNLTPYKLIVIEIIWNQKVYYYEVPINKYLFIDYPNFIVEYPETNELVFENYLSLEKAYIIKGQNDDMVCYSYRQNFRPALPPMITSNRTQSKDLLLDSIFVFQHNIQPDSISQLLFIQSDSTTDIGRGYVSVTDYFPKFRTFDELIEPLIYISTKEEFQVLKRSNKKKDDFERFWISRLSDKKRAKIAIKKYYQNVVQANMFFTTYKEGWKTDPGMIYAVFGRPFEVKRNEFEEKWSYFMFGEVITFNFEKIPNLFVRQHLRLIRDEYHKQTWFRKVASWRKGNL